MEDGLTPEAEQYASDYAQKVLSTLEELDPLQAIIAILYIQSNFIFNLRSTCKRRRRALVDEMAYACHESFIKWDKEEKDG